MEKHALKQPLRRAVFLDRDGVLNQVAVVNGLPQSPSGLADLRIMRDAPSSLARLKAAGFLLICVTNQPNVARGIQSREVVDAINTRLKEQLPLDDLLVCYHDDADGCDCRKPLPGLLLTAARERSLDLASSFMVGDRWRDIEAGRRAGCATVLLDCGYGEKIVPEPDKRVKSLRAAASWILAEQRRKGN